MIPKGPQLITVSTLSYEKVYIIQTPLQRSHTRDHTTEFLLLSDFRKDVSHESILKGDHSQKTTSYSTLQNKEQRNSVKNVSVQKKGCSQDGTTFLRLDVNCRRGVTNGSVPKRGPTQEYTAFSLLDSYFGKDVTDISISKRGYT